MSKILIFKKHLKPARIQDILTKVNGHNLLFKMVCYLETISYVFLSAQ